MKQIPNILTVLRLILTLAVFAALLVAAANPTPGLFWFAFWGFCIAAVTDFFDGWLARKWQVESLTGAILDPIADKVLVAGAIVGLAVCGDWMVGGAGGLILFREFSVSALREVLAPRGLRLPVTMLAKWKTTLQLVALTAALLWHADPALLGNAALLGQIASMLMVLAALITVWTGIEYGVAARRALKATPPPAA